ncbi:replication protein A 32 kDa subunit-B-like [Amphiura filiformis]|uniref:replication protein A 32 kDa subunit-B-like n=1 Tax=Amphiura filiformis TaxID=82378 RepID=UPI003B228080
MWGNQGGFGDGGGGGGGGFNQQGGGFNSPGGGGGFGSPSQSQGGGGKGRRVQSLIPCTIAQVLSATQVDESFKIGEVEVYQVAVVGVIRRVETSSTNILYQLDDMTGPTIDIRHWIDNDETAPQDEQPQSFRENSYIKVVGNIRTFGGKRSIGPFKIMPVTDMNELTVHMLEVVHSHMLLTKMATQGAGTFGGGQQQFTTPMKGGPGMANTPMQPTNGLNNVQRQVQQLIVSCQDEQGISMNELQSNLKGIQREAIRNAVEFLSNEGHIYSTVDEDHFKSTDG